MKWKHLKCGVAMVLAAVLALPILPARAEEELSAEKIAELEAAVIVPEGEPVTLEDLSRELEISSDKVVFNTGSGNVTVAQGSVSGNDCADDYFAEDGSYTIQTELNAFFPYEVQFTYNGEVSRQWFVTPDSSVEIGGHTFYVNAAADGTMVTQMSLEVGGDTIVVYPEEKEFPEDGIMPLSLLPIREVSLAQVDLSGYTPVELTQVSATTLLGNNVAAGDTIVWKSNYVSSRDEYIVSTGDKLDLSVNTNNNTLQDWELIVGSGDQLDADAVRYRLSVKITKSRNWLAPAVYTQNEQGVRTLLQTIEDDTYYYDYERDDREMRIYAATSQVENLTSSNINSAYVSLGVNSNVFPGNYHLRAFEGNHNSAAEAMAATEITDRIFCGDMTQANAGYLLQRYADSWITVVSFDDNGNVTGYLPFRLYLNTSGYTIRRYSLEMESPNGMTASGLVQTSRMQGGDYYSLTYTLYKGCAANGTYYQRFAFIKDGVDSPESVIGAYPGLYNSIAEATAAGAVDIKADLFGQKGYAADYSNGVYITIFAGENYAPKTWRYRIKTEEGTISPNAGPSSGSQVTFHGFKTDDGTSIPCYQVSSNDDSYGEYNYLTVLVDQNVSDDQLAHLAPEFYVSSGAKLYAAGSSTADVSGQSFHDFTNMVQYTVSAEDGENARNYWVQVVRASDGAGRLYINSLKDADAGTQVVDGVIYSTREVMLDGYHYNVHDILFANMGTEAVKKLSVELVSDTVQLNDYWTLKGDEDLSGFVDTKGYQPAADGSPGNDTADYGELWNLAKVRLTAKRGVAAGTDVSGTLTVKSGGKVLMVLTLTGTVGNPSITTTEIPEAVRYVPYGTMIQNSNKYSWNKVNYELYEGALPAGMTLKLNGELYGVPTEAGSFTFTVKIENSYSSFGTDYHTYTMVVKENTDENVDAATDSGYDLTQRVQYEYSMAAGDQLMVSQGVYGEFVDLYLDGRKLTDGVDYISESGSTRITIYAQTLTNGLSNGTHTLGMEFRTQADTLKRAAQNYVIGDVSSDSGQNGSDDDGDDDSDSSSGSTAAQSGTAADAHAKYTVVKGDTLGRIAKKHGISLAQLLAWNSQIKNPNLIYPGQIITVGVIQGAGVAALSTDGAVYDEVKRGDCLYKIAMRNGITLKAVTDMNPEIAKQKYIYAGQKIRVK